MGRIHAGENGSSKIALDPSGAVQAVLSAAPPPSSHAYLQGLILQQIELMSKQRALLADSIEAFPPSEFGFDPDLLPADDEVVGGSQTTQSVLAPGQMEHWLAASVSKKARLAVNESLCLNLEGNVDPGLLREAAEAVMARHAAFKLTFSQQEPLQIVNSSVQPSVAQVDLRGVPNTDAAFEQFCLDATKQIFELDTAPLAAAYVVLLGEQRTAFLLVVSHLVFDGWASDVFVDELAQTYRARVAGSPALLPPAASPLQFAEEEAARFAGSEGQESLSYWTALLTNPPPLLDLHDRAPSFPRMLLARTARASLDGPTLERMRQLARSSGATLFQFMLAAVAAMLREQSKRSDFVIGIPYAGQTLKSWGPLIVDGVLDLPLRLQLTNQDSMADTLRHVRSRLMDAIEHPLATQGVVARALGIRSVDGRQPLTGIYFNLNPPIDLQGFSPLKASLREAPKQGILSDLFFSFYEQADGLALDLHYSSDLFTDARAAALIDSLWAVCRRWAGHNEEVKNGGTEHAAAAPLLGGSRQQEPGATIQKWFCEQASRTPDLVAVTVQEQELTYRDLDLRSNAVANVLIARGATTGALVGICLGRGPDLLPALLGVLKAGAAYVPLDPGFPAQRLRYMAEDAGLGLVITDAVHAGLTGVARELQIRVDDDAAEIASEHGQCPTREIGDESTAYVIYTSGSTGKPKGVVIPQRAVCNFLRSMRDTPGISQKDVLLAVTTLSFDIAVLELFLPLTVGARIVLAQREEAIDGRIVAALIERHAVTVMQATPSTWQILLDSGWKPRAGFRALCGGESLPPSLAKMLVAAGVELWNMYGPTETTVWSTIARLTEPVQRIHIGLPIDNTQVWIVDEHLTPCAPGVEGEIVIGGVGVGTGYHNLPQLTAERFISSAPFLASGRAYRTGDLGRVNAGVIEHLGRMDAQVKIRGHRVELGEAERVIGGQPGVAEVVVTAEAGGGTALCAYLRATGPGLDVQAVRNGVAEILPDYMVPVRWVLLEAFPHTPNGKIDRRALSEMASSQESALARAEYLAPETDAELALAPIWASVLNVRQPGVLDDFFDAGGHSILAMTLMLRIKSELGYELPLEALFDRPNIRGLAAAISSRLELGAGVMVNLREARATPTLILIAGVGGHIFAYHKFAQALPVAVPTYGMKAIGIDGSEPPLEDIPQIASRYVRELLAQQPDGPYVIAGYSVGARIALEMALQLEALGKSVPRLVSFDMYAPGHPRAASLRKRLQFHWRQFRQRNWQAGWAYVKEKGRFAMADEAQRAQHELEKLGIIPREILESIGRSLLNASMNYKPSRKMQGKIVSIICTNQEAWQNVVETTAYYGWEECTTGGIEVHQVHAAHVELFKEGVFEQMTSIIGRVLVEARKPD